MTPLALTAEQAEGLPRVPIKASDGRKNAFEALYGGGAVELDALEALRPGEFARIVHEAIEPYLDPTLSDRLEEAEAEATQMVEQEWTEAIQDIQNELTGISEEAAAIAGKYRDRLKAVNDELQAELAPLKKRLAPLRAALAEKWEEFNPDLPERPVPEIDEIDESEWLFDSSREYMAQLAFYKQRKKGNDDSNGSQDAA